MNSQELITEILNDYPIVSRKSKFISKKIRMEAIKTKNKYLSYINLYKSKQNNDWLILTNYNNRDHLILNAVYFLNKNGINAVVIQWDTS